MFEVSDDFICNAAVNILFDCAVFRHGSSPLFAVVPKGAKPLRRGKSLTGTDKGTGNTGALTNGAGSPLTVRRTRLEK